ncbi:MAG: ribbon-helix-helix domain-containing protein [Candidatus Diapherotrites archaeon]
MQQYVMNMEPALIKEVDKIVKSEKLHNSRNEFIRDAVRSKVLEFRRSKVRKMLREIRDNALKNGWNGELLTREERDKMAKEFMKKKGFSLD